MTKILLPLIVLLGCNAREPQTCDYTIQDQPDLTCISIPAAEWNYKEIARGEFEMPPNHVWIGDICRGKYIGEWIYRADTEYIKELMQSASYLDAELDGWTTKKEVSQWTCYYYNVK